MLWPFKKRKSMSHINQMCKFWVNMRQQVTKTTNPAFFANEFNLLLRDSRIHYISIIEDGRLYIRTRVFWKHPNTGRRYYIATYLIRIDTYHVRVVRQKAGESLVVEGFKIDSIDSGRHDSKKSGLYFFGTNNDSFPGGFCFGDRNLFVRQLLGSGEFFTLIKVVLESLWHINTTDYEAVEKKYREVFPDNTIEAPRGAQKEVSLLIGPIARQGDEA